MIASLERVQRNVQKVQMELSDIVLDAVRVNEDSVLNLNRNEQMYNKGQDSAGQSIRPKYRPYTVRQKARRGQPYDRVTLRDEGDFHESMFIYPDYSGGEFEIRADDPKVPDLQQKYGPNILGLTPDNVIEAGIVIKDELQRMINKQLLA